MNPKAEIVTLDPAGLERVLTEMRQIAGQVHFGMGGPVLARPLKLGGHTITRTTPISLRREGQEVPLTVATCIGPLNRPINPGRVDAYCEDMKFGRWWFTPDPIVVTTAGYVINGQHRLLAAEELVDDFQEKTARARERQQELPAPPQWPQFVVVWGVDKKAAILMDEARRTATDRRDIAVRFAGAA
jgi:hypothetical protein